MRKYIKNLPCYLMGMILCLCSCAIPKQVTEKPEPLPSNFMGQNADSVSLARVPWKQFFQDKALIRLIDTALIRNADLAIAMEQIQMAKAYLNMGRGAMFPKANLNGTLARINPSNNQIETHLGLNLETSWEVDLWGKLSNRRKAARAKWLASQSGSQLIKSGLISDVARGYFELMTLDVEKEIMDKNIRLQKSALEIVQAQKIAGKSTDLAVQQFEAQLSNTMAQRFNVEQQLIVAEGYLNILLNRMPQKIERGKNLFEQGFSLDHMVGIPAQLLTNRPDIIQASLELEASGFELKAALKDFLPSVRLDGSIGYSGINTSEIFNPSKWANDFLAGLTAPIFQQNIVKGNYLLRESAQKQALIKYASIARRAVNEVQIVIDKLSLIEKEIQNRQHEVKVLSLAIQTANDLYVYGYANYLEVINAQKNARDAELNYADAYKSRINLSVELYKVLGGGIN